MPTTQEEKPAKPRSRSRKADRRNSKSEQKRQAVSERVKLDAESSSPAIASTAEIASPIEDSPIEALPMEAAPIEASPMEAAPIEAMPATPAAADVAPIAAALENAAEAALSGEVLPPEARPRATPTAVLPAIVQAYGDYTRNSWTSGRFLVERMIAARSFDQAFEIQGEFAKQAYGNFLAQSQKMCVLYGEWAQQFFRPFDRFATRSNRIGR